MSTAFADALTADTQTAQETIAHRSVGPIRMALLRRLRITIRALIDLDTDFEPIDDAPQLSFPFDSTNAN